MTIDEAARRLGLSPHTLRAQVSNGRLHTEKHGRDHWLTDDDLAAYRRDHQGRVGRPFGSKTRTVEPPG